MIHHTKLLLGMLMLAMIPALLSADEPTAAGDFGRRAASTPKTAANRAAVSQTPTGSYCLREVLAKGVTIQPGANGQYELDTDIGGADQVTVSIMGEQSLAKARIGIAFAAPGDWYVFSTATLGTSLPWLDHGAITVPVAGPGLKVIVFNEGTTAFTIRQLAVYVVLH